MNEQGELYSLTYFSEATGPVSLDDLEALLAVSRNNNRHMGITGVLLYEEGHFLQVLEGREDRVTGLFEKIRQDARHEHVAVVQEGPIEERSFHRWSMAHHKIDPSEPDLRDGFLRIMSDYDTEEGFKNDLEFLLHYLKMLRGVLAAAD